MSQETDGKTATEVMVSLALLNQRLGQVEMRGASHTEALDRLTQVLVETKEILRTMEGATADLRAQHREIDQEALPRRLRNLEKDLTTNLAALQQQDQGQQRELGELRTLLAQLKIDIDRLVETGQLAPASRSKRETAVAVGGGASLGVGIAELIRILYTLFTQGPAGG